MSSGKTQKSRKTIKYHPYKKECIYGNGCLRKNPAHFIEYSHPPKKLVLLEDMIEHSDDNMNPKYHNIFIDNKYGEPNSDYNNFVEYMIINFEYIIKNYDITKINQVIINLDQTNTSRQIKSCNEKLIKKIENYKKDFNNDEDFYKVFFFNDANHYNKSIEEGCIPITSSSITNLIQRIERVETQSVGSGRRRRRRRRATHRRATHRRATHRRNI